MGVAKEAVAARSSLDWTNRTTAGLGGVWLEISLPGRVAGQRVCDAVNGYTEEV